MTEVFSADSPWLVIIDMQNVFRPPSDWGCPRFDAIIKPIRELAPKYGDRTLMTRFVAGTHHRGSWVPYYKEFSFADVPNSDPIYDIVDELKDLAHADNVVTMTTFSKWGDARNGVRAKTGEYPRLVLAGVATDCCVLSTAMTAAEAGAFVTVILDACAGSSDENQLAAKNIMKGYAPLIEIKSYQEC